VSNWRLAKSLIKLRDQINEAYPARDKSSDGSIGDASHQARAGASDHNPNAQGVVCAIDIDADLSPTVKVDKIVQSICESQDPRVKYIIRNKRITKKGSKLQQWEPYHGINPHDHHAHISVFADKCDMVEEWNIDMSEAPTLESIPNNEAKPSKSFYKVRSGDTLSGIARTYKTSVQDIKALNGLHSDLIKTGQTLRIK
jgi:LysM repeat protein